MQLGFLTLEEPSAEPVLRESIRRRSLASACYGPGGEFLDRLRDVARPLGCQGPQEAPDVRPGQRHRRVYRAIFSANRPQDRRRRERLDRERCRCRKWRPKTIMKDNEGPHWYPHVRDLAFRPGAGPPT